VIHPPTPYEYAYWVIPGRLLAGGYPGSRYFEETTRTTLRKLLCAGIYVFFNLTPPGDLPSYEAILQEQAASLGISAEHNYFPISDFTIPLADQMSLLLNAIDSALGVGKGVYVHCQAGIGRTGTVIGCYLARHGLPGDQALLRLAELRRGLPNAGAQSPETEEQRSLVCNWQVGQ